MRVEGLSVIYAESVGNRGEAKAALSGLAAHGRSNQPQYSLPEVVADPTIYLIPECDTEEDVSEFLRELCEEIFVEQLASWFTDESTWPARPQFRCLLPLV